MSSQFREGPRSRQIQIRIPQLVILILIRCCRRIPVIYPEAPNPIFSRLGSPPALEQRRPGNPQVCQQNKQFQQTNGEHIGDKLIERQTYLSADKHVGKIADHSGGPAKIRSDYHADQKGFGVTIQILGQLQHHRRHQHNGSKIVDHQRESVCNQAEKPHYPPRITTSDEGYLFSQVFQSAGVFQDAGNQLHSHYKTKDVDLAQQCRGHSVLIIKAQVVAGYSDYYRT
ncbi:hypothetical protein ES703_37950 [subsurface metagenome]